MLPDLLSLLLYIAVIAYGLVLQTVISQQTDCRTGDVRLTNGSSHTDGIPLQICYDNEWVEACYEGFNDGAAAAACRQLGYVNYDSYSSTNTTVSLAFKSITCPTVSNYILYGELAILRCSIDGGPTYGANCNPVIITCASGHRSYEGQVYFNHEESDGLQIYWNNDWHHICYNQTIFANDNVGMSICRQLGYTNLKSVTPQDDNTKQSYLNIASLSCINISLPCFSHCITDVIVTQDCPGYEDLLHATVQIECEFNMAYLINSSSGSETLCKLPNQACLTFEYAAIAFSGIIVLAMTVICLSSCVCCVCCIFSYKKSIFIFKCCKKWNNDTIPLINNEKYICFCFCRKKLC